MWTTEFERMRAQPLPKPQPLTGSQKQWLRLIGAACFSLLFLWGANLFVHGAVKDAFWADNASWLIWWGGGVIIVIARELIAGVPSRPLLRSIVPALVIVATAGFSLWYAVAALSAHARASASRPERTFELTLGCGKNCIYQVHQRPDGTTIEGIDVGGPVEEAYSCTIAQRLDGDRGFSWIRVIERSPPPPSEIAWPIRRQLCFSNIPLAEVKG